MELLLNLAWVAVGLGMVCLWLRCAPQAGGERLSRRRQFIALSLLILLLFPVISVTDDLLAAENPAETDSVQRRDHESVDLHAPASLAACPPEDALSQLPPAPCGYIGLTAPQLPHPAAPALAPIENRPPPTA